MDEALRYNQQLQFCKQLHCLQVQLCEDTYLSDELLNSLYALGKFCKTPACALQQLAATYPEVRPRPHSTLCSTVEGNNNTSVEHRIQQPFPAAFVPLPCSLLLNCSVLSSNTRCGRCT